LAGRSYQKLDVNVAKRSTPAISKKSGKFCAAQQFSRFERGRERWGGVNKYLSEVFKALLKAGADLLFL
jgi:hypothetical protein